MAGHAASKNLADASGEADAAIAALSISQDIARLEELGLLDILLADRSTGGNIVWATSSYAERGEGFQPQDQISAKSITGTNAHVVRTRARKQALERAALTKAHAEVFTPTWVCKRMIDAADDAWMEDVGFSKRVRGWQKYVASPRLEITCGEAPYVANRYDAETGVAIAASERMGMLDRKLHLITENTKTRRTWMKWAKAALQSVYGYELQGDNLLIARVNVLMSVAEHADAAGYAPLTKTEWKRFADIASWNVWQMDGITKCVPFGRAKREEAQLSFLGDLFGEEAVEEADDGRGYALIRNWETDEIFEFERATREGKHMKFDYIIGNPPYQEEQEGDNVTYAPPVYDKFMDSAYEVADRVELITPARFLFNAGSTPKAWNKKMLEDPHLKVIFYEPSSQKVFPPPTDIKGGVSITYRDATKQFGPIEVFTPYDEINETLQKVKRADDYLPMSQIVFTRTAFRLTEKVHKDYPKAQDSLSNGHMYDMSTNIIDLLPYIFHEAKPDDDKEYIQIYGRANNQRVCRFVLRGYVNGGYNLDAYKILIPKADGSGNFGETITFPVVAKPMTAYTESFLSIGRFGTKSEADACLQYIKGKFARAMLGILKITQDNAPKKWKYVPLQDFTSNSDIDWSKSVAEIDQQLYKKYGLSDEEVEFIETHVKEMS